MQKKLAKGETVFLWILVLFCLFWLWQSYLVLQKDPGLATEGAFPFMCSAIMLIMTFLSLLEIRKYEKAFPQQPKQSVLEKCKETVVWLFPGKVVIVLVYILLYALLLKTIGFIISTFLFLAGSMITLWPKKIVKTLIISAAVVAFIYFLFQIVFKVRLP